MPLDPADVPETLRRLASILGVSVTDFLHRATLDHQRDATEYLTLWHRIESPDGRRRALDFLRSLAEEEQAQSASENARNGS